jgi:hypothetical protein
MLNFIFGFSGVIDTAETDFRDFRSDYLGEYVAKCETVLARESGPRWGWFVKKTRGRKSRATVPLSRPLHVYITESGAAKYIISMISIGWADF